MVNHPKHAPVVSVVVPVYNRSHLIKECMDALLQQDAKFKYEIVLVDDKSTDDTLKVLYEWKKRYPLTIVVVEKEQNAGQWKARNLGVEKASGKIIVFTDSDVVVRPDWLAKLTKPLREDGEEASQGYSTGETKNVWQKLIQETYDQFVAGMVKNGYSTGYDTRNSAVLRDVFLRLKGFETRHAEDADFGAKLVANNVKIKFVPEAINFHYHRKELLKDMKANYQFATRYPLIIRRNHHLLMAQASLVIRLAAACYFLLLILLIPVLFFFPSYLIYYSGAAILFFLLVGSRAFKKPYNLVLYRMVYLIAQALATLYGFVKGIPMGLTNVETGKA